MGKHLRKAAVQRLNTSSRPRRHCLGCSVQRLLQPEGFQKSSFQFTGYLRWQSEENPELEKTLHKFTEGRKVTILTFGSVSFDNTESLMQRFLRNWPTEKKTNHSNRLGRAISSRGKGRHFICGKGIPDQLFSHGSVIIHHGGAGTTASALHAGVPQVIVPHFVTNFFGLKKSEDSKQCTYSPQALARKNYSCSTSY